MYHNYFNLPPLVYMLYLRVWCCWEFSDSYFSLHCLFQLLLPKYLFLIWQTSDFIQLYRWLLCLDLKLVQVVGVTGLILTKLDGSARGGCVVIPRFSLNNVSSFYRLGCTTMKNPWKYSLLVVLFLIVGVPMAMNKIVISDGRSVWLMNLESRWNLLVWGKVLKTSSLLMQRPLSMPYFRSSSIWLGTWNI